MIEAEPRYTPRPLQLALHRLMAGHRFGVGVCHRRFGKTTCAINHLILTANQLAGEGLKDPRCAYIAPTYKQAKLICWDYAKWYGGSIPGVKTHETELRVDFPGGARVRLLGCDNKDSLRGAYLDRVVFDEYAKCPPSVFPEVILPQLVDRRGRAFFYDTPKGKNHFWELLEQAKADPEWFAATYPVSETKIIPLDELKRAKDIIQRLAPRLGMTAEDLYDQEFECSFVAAVLGAIWGKEMAEARRGGRLVPNIEIHGDYPVETWWDLGMDDTTCIWFTQTIGRQIRLVDFYEANGHGLPYYVKVLADRGYRYGTHNAPHDISVRELGSGKSRIETAASLGLIFRTVPRPEDKMDALEASRTILPYCWFDESRCAPGISHLEQYRRKWDEIASVWGGKPVHDEHSNGADAFQTLALGHSFSAIRGSKDTWGGV